MQHRRCQQQQAEAIKSYHLSPSSLPTPKIWDIFFENEDNKRLYNIYVHPKWPNNITSKQPYIINNILPQHLLINNTVRFDYSLVEATNAMFKYALNDKLNQTFILLSETTIPLYNFNTIYDKLMYNNNDFSWGLTEGTEGHVNCFEDIYNGIKAHAMVDIGMAEIEFLNKFVPRDICIHTTQWM